MTEPHPSEPAIDVSVGRNGSYRVWHDPWDDDVYATITRALTAIDDIDEAAVGQALTEHIDPDNLNHLFQPHDNEGQSLGWQQDHVTIEFETHEITIHTDGLIEIEP